MSKRIAIVLIALVTGCSGSADRPDAAAASDAGGGGVDTGTPAGDDAGAPGALHDCEDADFEDLSGGAPDDRMIMVPRGTTTFDHPCMTISAGQAVMFMWDFSMHPLVAGVAPGHSGTGTEPSPIVGQTSGELYEPAFPAAGDYPFHCGTHGHGGMYGVVRVLP